ncbi:MAG: MarR family winged helix-turn-helix transcriptional regulator [Candidatus Cloacimonetes bacterium]|jgi:DNA-binding MarR family transcriptional regulator|nr:MarR family winged helix-turn-helix transcriptional regulator [Candidatus Cloacimonadota bacterium]
MSKSVGRLVSVLYRRNQAYLDAALKEYNLTASELAFIISLYRKDGISQEELSTRLAIDKAATANALRSLENKGYVSRMRNPQDRRANIIIVTEYARRMEEGVREQLVNWTNFLTEGIDQESVETMFEVLEKMVKKVESIELCKKLGGSDD